jgi:hypothetical protein
MAYFAINDINAGYIQWVGEADDERDAIVRFDAHVGIDPHGLGLDKVSEELEVRELHSRQYAYLKGCAGDHQEGILYLSKIQRR